MTLHPPCNVGAFSPIPPYIEERPNKNVYGRSGDRTDDATKFDEFWRVYPSRGGHSNPKKPAQEKFDAAIKRGIDPDLIVCGAGNYAEAMRRSGTAGKYIAQAQTWLTQERWQQYATLENDPEPLRAGMV
jgi:hypothetical protein